MKTEEENEWIEFEGNEDLFEEEAKKDCLCKFDDGTEQEYGHSFPNAILTHFKRVV